MFTNPYFQAVEAKTPAEADALFDRLLRELKETEPRYAEPGQDGRAREKVVADILSTAVYFSEADREQAGRLYANRSPFR